MALIRALSGGSGGGEYKTGTGSTSSAGQEVTIHTGLSSVSEFYMVGNMVGLEDSNLMAVSYRNDRTYKQTDCEVYSTTNHFLKYNDFATSHVHCTVITGISGGDVTIKTGTENSTWGSIQYYWMAK